MSAFELLFWPFLCCLVLTGIHAYLGLHVVQRGVIFVDLSLAQIAALGATIAFLFGHDLHSQASYFYSLGFTLLGALLFATTRLEKRKVPQEAFIGIVYAVSAAASILIVDRAPEGVEHLKYILVGNLLAVSPKEVGKMAILYALVGLIHWFYRRMIFAVSLSPQEAEQKGISVRFWDFVFYGTFGFVVTSSVAVAGVLLVFSFLIVPSVIAILFSERIGMRLFLGWGIGAAASLLGILGSYFFDFPTGATIVVTFGFLFLLALLIQKINSLV
ncbi:MAG: metal ABC transporter permease [Elusimicrobia bacterium]|nr:metal ABC transporter permease [Elusimicrobiota bacterium]